MNEHTILDSLVRELKDLGYPEGALRREVPIAMANGMKGYIDLTIIDQDSNEVIAIFEVKRRSEYIHGAAQQIIRYAKALPKSILCYAYVRDNEGIEIAQVNQDDGFITLVDSLPTYDSLKSTYFALNKIKKKAESLFQKTNSAKKWSSIVAGATSALTLGITASMTVGLFTSEQKSLTQAELTNKVIMLEEQSKKQQSNYEDILVAIEGTNASIKSLTSVPEDHGWKIEASKIQNELDNLQGKLKALEDALTVNPAKALSMPILRKDLDNTEKSLRSELLQTRSEIDRMYDQNKWFIGLMFTIALSVLGIAISSFFNRNDT
ncbi:type I restriction enzyme HsdR N-terminal domain-containing protein [Vibrio campbellii]|uniref:type I restriction enzyme HsdR N-terminal domain-containing protein n=1 Tax=Vibrio campbellii TaxID=680 RepID=UPI0013158577|nr:type I restriction enzyme HsdR N-terminal domain-containing protein [Vibrio campbellii]